MKNLTILITLILSLFFITTSCDSGGTTGEADTRDDCFIEMEGVARAFKRCNTPENIVNSFSEYENKIGCNIYSKLQSDNWQTCSDALRELSCEDVNKITTVDDIDSSLGCFDFPRKTKKEVCAENYKSYCSSSFHECGESALTGICDEAKNIYGSSESREISFDDTKLDNHCKTRTDANEEIEMSDFFNETCFRYRNNLECNSVPEFDFRNDDWKTQCSQE